MAENKKNKVLIVEDDNTISWMYKTKLEADGYTVVVADNGEDGIAKAKQEQPNLILLDVIIPRVDGFSVLEEVKSAAETKDIPVVMLTNLGTEEDKEKGKKFGAADYLVKANTTPSQISELVKKFLNK